ncbi:hypothetical protein CF386_10210 [Paraphotobacterium marinum]|uniref:Glycine zipper domain-containing protein n=1 Tax=Paraphotobacterium marinum TaxID=1755811 RepID=A0A220VG99_9GAMM|nr:hypothetical protein [Paraphotobacterium marinum]ASK79424.1 hypothetical protein CF386_10210 [Paraphotobacterium marinum]
MKPVFLICLTLILMTGCSSEKILSQGEVVKSITINKRGNAENAGIVSEKDAGTGAEAGAITGGLLGLAYGPLCVITCPIGAIAGGVTGAVTGGTYGAVDGATNNHAVLYSYLVHDNQTQELILIHQYDKQKIQDHQMVNIYKNKKGLFIKPVNT